MSEVTINYKDAAIATMDASGTKTLQTQGKYCEDDIEVVYARPSAPSGTKQISITQNGTTVEDVAAYANAEITVNVQSGAAFDICDTTLPTGAIISDYKDAGGLLPGYAITHRSGITSVKLTEATSIQGYAISNCSALTVVVLLKVVTVANYGITANTALTAVDMLGGTGAYSRIYANAFNGCSALNTLIIRADLIEYLSGINAFNNTPFSSGGSGGTLYVPQSRIAEYTQATNWNTILGYANNQILPIEGSIYETQYADGTPIT